MLHHLHRRWIQAGAAALLLVTLSGCNRSASGAMTPLPSAPPPTPTGIAFTESVPEIATEAATEAQVETELSPTTPPVFVTDIPPSTDTPAPTASGPTPTATATKAVVASESACGNALPTRLSAGSFAYVNPDPPLPNNLRSDAGQDNELVGTIPAGQAMKILDGPKCADGSLWWKVSVLNSDLVGWTAEGDDKSYWLVPCSSENDCGS